jgi:hypothetical protein
MSSVACCDSYEPVRDPEEDEVICKHCGAVNEQETILAQHLGSEENQTPNMQATSHNITNELLLVENGAQHSYISNKNRGLAFELGSRGVLEHPYVIGMIVERNVRIVQRKDGTYRAIADYFQDKWWRMGKQMLWQISVERQLEPHQVIEASRQLKRMYSQIVVQILPELLAELAYSKATSYEPHPKYYVESLARIDHLKEKLRAKIMACSQGMVQASMNRASK